MHAMVTARVPLEIRDQVNAKLRSIGSSPTELVNATGRISPAHHPHRRPGQRAALPLAPGHAPRTGVVLGGPRRRARNQGRRIAMRLLIDSDVLLDFIGERESTAAAWVKLHAMELAGAAELWVSAEAFGEVRAALAEALSDHDARSALRSAMAFLSVCSIDGPDVRFALEHEGLPYRAALTESCARKLQADFIVTHGGEVSVSRAVRRVAPDELFSVLEAEQGIVFDVIDF